MNSEDIDAIHKLLNRVPEIDGNECLISRVNTLVNRYKQLESKIRLLSDAIEKECAKVREVLQTQAAAYKIIGELVTEQSLRSNGSAN